MKHIRCLLLLFVYAVNISAQQYQLMQCSNGFWGVSKKVSKNWVSWAIKPIYKNGRILNDNDMFFMSKDGVQYEMLNHHGEQILPYLYTEADINALQRGVASSFIKEYVERHINQWQKKGDFEKLADYKNRVSNLTRNNKIVDYAGEAKKTLQMVLSKEEVSFILCSYDTENETYLMVCKYGEIIVPVPIKQAEELRTKWENVKSKVTFNIGERGIVIQNVDFMYGKKILCQYKIDKSAKYQELDIKYNFAKIDMPQSDTYLQNNKIEKVTVDIGLSDIEKDIPITKQEEKTLFAVVIANENYQDVASVPYAINDGKVFVEYCQKTLGIPQSNISYVQNATLNNMRREINWLKQVVSAYNGEASVIFYYAGHGIPDETGNASYLLPSDGIGNDVTTGYNLQDLYSSLSSQPAQHVLVFLDACFSGTNRDGNMLASARGVAIKAKQTMPTGSLVVFSAAQGDETAWPYKDQQHGLFTYYLLKGIKKSKGEITLGELDNYVSSEVNRQSIVINKKSQTPMVNASALLGNSWKTWSLIGKNH